MSPISRLQPLAGIASFVLGIIFLLAAFSKIGDLEAFHKSLQGIAFLPLWIKGLSVLFIPGFELTLGLCLLARFAPKETSLLAIVLLLLFLCFGIYSNLVGETSGCGCFKIKTPTWLQLSGWWIVARNLVFLALGLVILRAEIQKDHKIHSAKA
jgi:uncharacterized membrane protein YphA (DoxX/SURF4 family)